MAELNKSQAVILDKFSKLESLSEIRDLTIEETEELRLLEIKLEQIWALEETKVRQRSKTCKKVTRIHHTSRLLPTKGVGRRRLSV